MAPRDPVLVIGGARSGTTFLAKAAEKVGRQFFNAS